MHNSLALILYVIFRKINCEWYTYAFENMTKGPESSKVMRIGDLRKIGHVKELAKRDYSGILSIEGHHLKLFLDFAREMLTTEKGSDHSDEDHWNGVLDGYLNSGRIVLRFTVEVFEEDELNVTRRSTDTIGSGLHGGYPHDNNDFSEVTRRDKLAAMPNNPIDIKIFPYLFSVLIDADDMTRLELLNDAWYDDWTWLGMIFEQLVRCNVTISGNSQDKNSPFSTVLVSVRDFSSLPGLMTKFFDIDFGPMAESDETDEEQSFSTGNQAAVHPDYLIALKFVIVPPVPDDSNSMSLE